ncbi:MAG: nitroreductase family protein [Muribaculaceae bacterium]|nr:nitroreductase family protein [Muribaculaceae bacterium]
MELNSFAQFANLVSSRHSCRKYKDTPVDHDLIRTVLDTARLAPSACNRQPWSFIVLEGEQGRDICGRAYDREWIRTAPSFIIVCGHHDEAWHRPFDGKDHTDVDIAIATEHICLTATTLGLGTCWVCNFDPATLSADLHLPEGVEPIVIIPIGYPDYDEQAPARKRKALDDILQWGVK